MCAVNGGCFIKVGQHIGALEFLLPKEYVETMKVFHSQAPQSSLTSIHKVIREELGKEVSLILYDIANQVNVSNLIHISL